MELFCFASDNLVNIRIGIGAQMWAVRETSDADMKARATKSKRLKVGSLALLYCKQTHSFTTPFIVYSQPNPDEVVSDVWPLSWRFPFRIHTLGTPTRQVHMEDAKAKWSILRNVGAGGVPAAIKGQESARC